MRKSLLLLTLLSGSLLWARHYKYEVTVLDMLTHEPVTNLEASIFLTRAPRFFWDEPVPERTDLPFEPSHILHINYRADEDTKVHLSIAREGYYTKGLGLPGKPTKEQKKITVYLPPEVNPIPMITRTPMVAGRDVKIPFNAPAGFDCLKADWLPPLGKGEQADLFFSLTLYREKGQGHFLFRIYFTNPNDGFVHGIKPYTGRMHIREFPENVTPFPSLEYTYSQQRSKLFSRGDPDPREYAFRVRTQLNADGSIASAYYGKVANFPTTNFGVPPEGPGWKVRFRYGLNPTPNDRNLEMNWESYKRGD